MKSFKAMMAEVAEPNSEEEKAFKAQHKVAVNKHPVATEFQHKGVAKPKAKRLADQEGSANYDLAYEATDYMLENPQEEIPMMMSQLAFLCYAAEEISGMLKLGGDPEEWFQNKLAGVSNDMQSMYAYMQGKNQMGEAVYTTKKEQLDELSKSTLGSYVKKASLDSVMRMGQAATDGDHKGAEKAGRRYGNVVKAVDRLTKEELSAKQKKIDLNKNGKVDGNDLAMLRAKKNEAKISKGYHKMPDGTIMKDSDHKDGVDKAVDRLTKEGYASAAQRKAVWASRNEKGVKEELKGNQHKLDKNKNGKIDAQDFKLLNKESVLAEISTKLLAKAAQSASDPMKQYDDDEKYHDPQKFADHAKKTKDAKSAAAVQGAADGKGHYPRPGQAKGYDSLASRTPPRVTATGKANKQDVKTLKKNIKNEEVELDESDKPVSPFDLKNYKSQIPTKPGEKAGFDSKKVSTGTVYSRKPVKEAAHESLDEAFKTGLVKLKDGSSMVLKKEDADILNKLLGKMSGGSVSKMTETAMKDKNGFAEILAFAKEAA